MIVDTEWTIDAEEWRDHYWEYLSVGSVDLLRKNHQGKLSILLSTLNELTHIVAKTIETQ